MESPLFEQVPNLFVFTASDKAAQANLPKSITAPISDRLVEKHFVCEGVDIHKLKSGPLNGFYAWGAVAGSANNRTWGWMKQGDVVLTGYGNAYHYVSTVIAKFHAPIFAAELWGYKDVEISQTWELMYFLSEPIPLRAIPYAELTDYLRSSYQGFTSIGSKSGNRLEKIYQDFGSLENFCSQRLHGYTPALVPNIYGGSDDSAINFDPSNKDDARQRVLRSIHQRRGQQKFRRDLMMAYKGMCAATGETCPAVLEAAHILPYKGEHTNHAQNGLLLRADIHTLFDLYLMTIDHSSYEIRISEQLQATSYSILDGKKLNLPLQADCQPSPEALMEHNQLFSEVNA